MELIRQLGAALGPTVVMVVGYNEFADNWVDSVDTTLAAFERSGSTTCSGSPSGRSATPT